MQVKTQHTKLTVYLKCCQAKYARVATSTNRKKAMQPVETKQQLVNTNDN